jgi:hypothetical protein
MADPTNDVTAINPDPSQILPNYIQPSNVQPVDMPQPSASTDAAASGGAANGSTAAPQGFLSKAKDALTHPMQTLKNVGNDIVQSGGKGTPVYSVDDAGKMTELATQATPGTLFKNLLVGALTGLGAATQTHGRGGPLGAAGAGFTAAMSGAQEQDDKARAKAVQEAQLKQQAQKAADEHNSVDQENAVRAATVTHLNAETAQATEATLRLGQEYRDEQFKNNQAFLDRLAADGGHALFTDLSEADALQKLKDDPTLAHSATYRVVGEKPVIGSDGQPVMVKGADGQMTAQMQPIYSIYSLPQEHTLTSQEAKQFQDAGLLPKGKIKDQTVSGAFYADMERKYQSWELTDLQKREYKANIQKNQAEANEANKRVDALTLDIGDKKAAKQAQVDYGNALIMAGNDPDKAKDILMQKFPDSFKLLASAESMEIAKNPTTETTTSPDGQTKTVTKMTRRLFTSDPQQSNGQTIRVTGPKGTFDIAANQLDLYKANGYSVTQNQQAQPQQQQVTPANVAKDMAVVKDAKGNTMPVAADAVGTFLKAHKDYSLVGYGTQEPTVEKPESPPSPNDYTGR